MSGATSGGGTWFGASRGLIPLLHQTLAVSRNTLVAHQPIQLALL